MATVVLGTDECERRCLMVRRSVSVQLHEADESQWMHHSGSVLGNVEEDLQKNSEIIMSFNACAKYWNGSEKLISIELLKLAWNKA